MSRAVLTTWNPCRRNSWSARRSIPASPEHRPSARICAAAADRRPCVLRASSPGGSPISPNPPSRANANPLPRHFLVSLNTRTSPLTVNVVQVAYRGRGGWETRLRFVATDYSRRSIRRPRPDPGGDSCAVSDREIAAIADFVEGAQQAGKSTLRPGTTSCDCCGRNGTRRRWHAREHPAAQRGGGLSGEKPSINRPEFVDAERPSQGRQVAGQLGPDSAGLSGQQPAPMTMPRS